jgi:hypothetical protein
MSRASDAIDGGAPQHFVDGLRPAVRVGAGLVGVGALAAPVMPGRKREARRRSGRSTVHARGSS